MHLQPLSAEFLYVLINLWALTCMIVLLVLSSGRKEEWGKKGRMYKQLSYLNSNDSSWIRLSDVDFRDSFLAFCFNISSIFMAGVWITSWIYGAYIPEGSWVWLLTSTLFMVGIFLIFVPYLMMCIRMLLGAYDLRINRSTGMLILPRYATPHNLAGRGWHRSVPLAECDAFELVPCQAAHLPWDGAKEDLLQLRLRSGECLPVMGFHHDEKDETLTACWRQLSDWLNLQLNPATADESLRQYAKPDSKGILRLPYVHIPFDSPREEDVDPEDNDAAMQKADPDGAVMRGFSVAMWCIAAGIFVSVLSASLATLLPPIGATTMDAFLKAREGDPIREVLKMTAGNRTYILIEMDGTFLGYPVWDCAYVFDESGTFIDWSGNMSSDSRLSKYYGTVKSITTDEARDIVKAKNL
ncbi:MAG: hypothetical protein ACAI35_19750 [Candidatus Methylacidiphilales bacterium]|nr:hypothetical protein [Candidatus Methylacidiphilales bacterium]